MHLLQRVGDNARIVDLPSLEGGQAVEDIVAVYFAVVGTEGVDAGEDVAGIVITVVERENGLDRVAKLTVLAREIIKGQCQMRFILT